ncbi:hypothetical protein TPHA_0A05060 [Tetrapisispora phaffii CBS 4417]|uniref:Maintenance of telomere capping protein 6 n=1 Tax=Tetrapisispora phaffii (strain ATCC 24235 / CBS 4417 / NBRC 1672 / NRRL Y-8282 / UCD 70-5) TaxID=1071381 RepID=G8BNV3_TETPH|nr:hypothetical protein TPHA_0A05060 [Tetrapisispora phaffii CBS 4417]CCE61581.1 hypothetical protein TPHA_0A05060 [Tetrapisispora phaffii CBS 4417]
MTLKLFRYLFIGICCLLVLNSIPTTFVNADTSSAKAHSISSNSSAALSQRSQRDIEYNITIDQLPLTGIELKSVLLHSNFSQSNDTINNDDLLNYYYDILSSGVQNVIVDLELTDNIWTLVDTSITFQSFLSKTKVFLDDTDTNLSANLFFMMLRIQNNSLTFIDYSSPSQNISALLEHGLGGSYIYKPDDLLSDRKAGKTFDMNGVNAVNGWPTLNRFLYEIRRRVVISEISQVMESDESPYTFNRSIMHFDEFNATLDIPTTVEEVRNTSLIPWRFLLSNFTESDGPQYISYGYSPIIANKFDSSNILLLSDLTTPINSWSWKVGEPKKQSSLPKDKSFTAYNCGYMSYTVHNISSEWIVGNCYDKLYGLCRSYNDNFGFILSENENSYFDFDSFSGSNCPDGFDFSIPSTPLQKLALEFFLKKYEMGNINIWIDINSISVSDCWVTGGPFASCPYQKVMSGRNFTRMLTPACVCSFGLLVIVTLLNLLSAPIHDNRNNWKKVISKMAVPESDGVPA